MTAAIGIGAATIVTLLGVAATVAVLAIYLITIQTVLTKVSYILGTVLIGVRSIANQTQPMASVIRDIDNDIAAARNALDGVVSGGSMRAIGAAPGRGRGRR